MTENSENVNKTQFSYQEIFLIQTIRREIANYSWAKAVAQGTSTLVYPANHSTDCSTLIIIIHHMGLFQYSRPNRGWCAKWTHSRPTPKKPKQNLGSFTSHQSPIPEINFNVQYNLLERKLNAFFLAGIYTTWMQMSSLLHFELIKSCLSLFIHNWGSQVNLLWYRVLLRRVYVFMLCSRSFVIVHRAYKCLCCLNTWWSFQNSAFGTLSQSQKK
jgi:hypothetical protein